jgi:hypothetical protein
MSGGSLLQDCREVWRGTEDGQISGTKVLENLKVAVPKYFTTWVFSRLARLGPNLRVWGFVLEATVADRAAARQIKGAVLRSHIRQHTSEYVSIYFGIRQPLDKRCRPALLLLRQ